jgi:crotonobetainyl-CoA:carnitine CoA-transferase CaiB-like acyl-CoA transferase
LPANDHLMQALSGVEASQGGTGQSPTFLVWGAIDTASGWVSACAILAGLYARRRTGSGQSVSTSLLGTALMMKSGAFLSGPKAVTGPVLDGDQRGYGAAYRIYQGSDDGWLALAIPDQEAWTRLIALVGIEGLPAVPPSLRTEGGEFQPEEKLLVAAFETGSAAAWVARLRVAGVPAELVAEVDRSGFVSRLLDDPVNRQFGRVVSYEWGARGLLEQVGFPIRFGPEPRPAERAAIPALGEHTAEILTAVGFSADEQAELARSGAIPD